MTAKPSKKQRTQAIKRRKGTATTPGGLSKQRASQKNPKRAPAKKSPKKANPKTVRKASAKRVLPAKVAVTKRPPKRTRKAELPSLEAAGAATLPLSERSHIIPFPSQPRIDFLQTLRERGFVFQITDENGLRDLATNQTLVGYIGFDCTARSLHVGSLVQIMLLRWLQRSGGKPIVLMGGATTRVGDPSDKETQRPMLTPDRIKENQAGIESVFKKFLRFDTSPSGAIMVDNREWLDRRWYMKFLVDYGPHFSINRMLTMDSVKLRLDRQQPLTFLEFNYMILQAYDFVELNRRYGCRLQMGGSDQWGNIVNGIELGRRVGIPDLFGLTSPLITTSSGSKMGKTATGAVWLNPDQTSPYEYWQHWRNTEDADVGRFLKLFTDLSLEEIARLEALKGAEINDAKKVLATEATALLHGRAEAQKAEHAARATFEQGARSDNLPTFAVSPDELAHGLRVAAAFVRAELVASNAEAKRHIAAGALRVNDNAVANETATLTDVDLVDGAIKLSLGRKKHALLRVM